MITGLVRFFYPDIKKEEVKKFGILAIALFFILGTYWIIRLLKDVLIYELAFPEQFWGTADYGRRFIATLKPISVVTVLCTTFLYAKLVDTFKKHQLFYVIISFYVAFFSIVTAVVLAMNTFGVEAVGKWPLAITGTAAYLVTETYGSLVVALFWSFTVSSSTSDQAKRCYPFIITVAQIGTILGASLVRWNLPDEVLFGLCLMSLTAVMLTIRYFVANVPAEKETQSGKKKKPDVFAGLKLILTQPYLIGVFVVSTFYEVAKTIVDYQMKSQAKIIPEIDFKTFVGSYGTYVNLATFTLALFGTSKLIKKFGLRFCLLFSPIITGCGLIGLYLYYQTGPNPTHLLYATMGMMILLTALSYAVNNPTKEMMYIPTSKDAKFKAKGLIDMLGGRSAKASGASIGGALNVVGSPALSLVNLMTFGTLISVGFVGAWIVAAIFVGMKNSQLVKEGKIIE